MFILFFVLAETSWTACNLHPAHGLHQPQRIPISEHPGGTLFPIPQQIPGGTLFPNSTTDSRGNSSERFHIWAHSSERFPIPQQISGGTLFPNPQSNPVTELQSGHCPERKSPKMVAFSQDSHPTIHVFALKFLQKYPSNRFVPIQFGQKVPCGAPIKFHCSKGCPLFQSMSVRKPAEADQIQSELVTYLLVWWNLPWWDECKGHDDSILDLNSLSLNSIYILS